jgi:tryptophan 2-monooxygenase
MLHDGYFQFQTVLNSTADRGVYLAGDSVSWYGGWIEGALQSGINAACAAAKRAGWLVRADSPLTQKAGRFDYGRRGRAVGS